MPGIPQGVTIAGAGLGIGFVLDYIDKATDPMKKTQDQVDKTKKSIKDLGDQTDATTRKIAALAKAHTDLSTSMLKIGVTAGATAYAISGLTDKLAHMFDGAIRGAMEFQTQIVATQFEIGKLGKMSYDQLSRSALGLSSTYNITPVDAARIGYQVGALYKTPGAVAAVSNAAGKLSESSGGQLNGTDSAKLITSLMAILNPQNAASANPNARMAGLNAAQASAIFHTLNRDSPLQYFQMPEFISSATARMQNMASMGASTKSQLQMLATGEILMEGHQNNPAYTSYLAGLAADLQDPKKVAQLRSYGIISSNGSKPRDIGDIIFGPGGITSSPMVKMYQSGQLAYGSPAADKMLDTIFGGMYGGQALRTLMQPGRASQFNRDTADLLNAKNNPNAINDAIFKLNQQRLDYQVGHFQNLLRSFSTYIGGLPLDALGKTLKVINDAMKGMFDFLEDHKQIGAAIVQFGALTAATVALGVALKGVSSGFFGLSTMLKMGERDLLLFVGGWGLLGIGVAAAALAINANFGGMSNSMKQFTDNFTKPLHNAKMVMEAFFELLAHPGHIDESLWKNIAGNGMGVLVNNIALLQYNMTRFFSGMSAGFNANLAPILNDITGQGGVFEILFGKSGSQGGLEYYMKMLNNHDFLDLGQTLGQQLAGGIKFLTGALKEMAPVAKWAFGALADGLNFLKNAPPTLLGLAGRMIGGPIGNAIQGYGAYKEIGSKDNAAQKGVAAGFFSTPFADVINGVTGVQQMQSSNWFSKFFGALQAGPAGIRLAQGMLNNSPLAGGDMAIKANNVYVNGMPVHGSGGGSADGGGSGWFHQLNETVHLLTGIATVGTLGKWTLSAITKFFPGVAANPIAKGLGWLFPHMSKLDPLNMLATGAVNAGKWGLGRMGLFGLGGTATAGAAGASILETGGLGLLAVAQESSKAYLQDQIMKLILGNNYKSNPDEFDGIVVKFFQKMFDKLDKKVDVSSFNHNPVKDFLAGYGTTGYTPFTPGKGPKSLMPNDPRFAAAAKKYGIPLPQLLAVAAQESGMSNIVGDNGHGRGVMQIDDRWHAADLAKHHGGADIAWNIDYGAAMLAASYKKYGNWEAADNEYNGGWLGAASGGATTTHTNGMTYGQSVQSRLAALEAVVAADRETHIYIDGKKVAQATHRHYKKIFNKDMLNLGGKAAIESTQVGEGNR